MTQGDGMSMWVGMCACALSRLRARTLGPWLGLGTVWRMGQPERVPAPWRLALSACDPSTVVSVVFGAGPAGQAVLLFMFRGLWFGPLGCLWGSLG